jgi:hypothetical protein
MPYTIKEIGKSPKNGTIAYWPEFNAWYRFHRNEWILLAWNN